MNAEKVIRTQLLSLLQGRDAHMTFDQAVEGFPLELINTYPTELPYTPWRLLEHMRIAQWDILEFIRNPQHISPAWPEGYWPPLDEIAGQASWEATIAGLRSELQAFEELLRNPDIDLFAPLPLGEKYTIFREILVLADHNAYHLGEFALLRQVMGAWPIK